MPKPDGLNMSLIATTSVRTCDQATQTDVCFYEVPNIYPEIYEQSMKGNDQIQYDALETFYDGLSKEDFLSNRSKIPLFLHIYKTICLMFCLNTDGFLRLRTLQFF